MMCSKSEFIILHMCLKGDHISLKKKGDFPFRHAIVVEPVQNQKDNVTVVYHNGSKSNARVECVDIDLFEQAKNGKLLRHRYEAIICYSGK